MRNAAIVLGARYVNADQKGHSTVRRRFRASPILYLLCLHAFLLVYLSAGASPGWNELGQLTAGLTHWRFGTFELNCVNPPLARLMASAAVAAVGYRPFSVEYLDHPRARPEFELGERFLEANGAWARTLFVLSRLVSMALTVLGGWVCWRWASELQGPTAGLIAAVLWIMSPTVLANGMIAACDAGAACAGLVAMRRFWCWLRSPGWSNAIAAALSLGFAQLMKTSWLVLFGLWPCLWGTSLLCSRAPPCKVKGAPRAGARQRAASQALQLAAMFGMAIYLINVGYLFEGSLTRLDEYSFVSKALGGPEAGDNRLGINNRFKQTWLARVPVPLPYHYVRGIDYQKADFEAGSYVYLVGTFHPGGARHFYLLALAVKEPLGAWVLACVAAFGGALALRNHRQFAGAHAADSGVSTGFGSAEIHGRRAAIGGFQGVGAWLMVQLTLLAPAVGIVLLVSMNPGIAFLRYVVPALPFLFIWIAIGAVAAASAAPILRMLIAAALVWSAMSVLGAFPYVHSYFNELAGGPNGGHKWLLGNAGDSSHDFWRLVSWADAHPEARPLGVVLDGPMRPEHFISDTRGVPAGPRLGSGSGWQPGPEPGWFALSANQVFGDRLGYIHAPERQSDYTYFQHMVPVDRVGYSIFIYNVTLDEANRVRSIYGLPLLPDSLATPR